VNQYEVVESKLLKGNAREAYKAVKCLTKTHQAQITIIEAIDRKTLAETVAVVYNWNCTAINLNSIRTYWTASRMHRGNQKNH